MSSVFVSKEQVLDRSLKADDGDIILTHAPTSTSTSIAITSVAAAVGRLDADPQLQPAASLEF